MINKFKIPNIYIEEDGYSYIAICLNTGKIFNDYLNKSGCLTQHLLSEFNIKTPSLYFRRKFFIENNKYWHEKYFKIEKIKNKETKKCKFCNWKTIDVNNKSGYYKTHLKKEHNKNINDYLLEYPEELEYFKKDNKKIDFENNSDNYVICKICGKKLKKIGNSHLKTHNITKIEYINKYSDITLCSKNYLSFLRKRILTINKNIKINHSSKEEISITNFLKNNNISFTSHNRNILDNGKEIDILIPDYNIGIEFNGNKHHTEWFGGKNKWYHLNKTIQMNKNGFGLIQIFDDELKFKNTLVFEKIKRILRINDNKIKIGGRNCIIKEVNNSERDFFLEKYHIQGTCSGSINIGGFYNEILVSIMVFKKIKDNIYELKRFATDYNYSIVGIGGKSLSFFIKNYINKNDKIISFADRRWTLNSTNNLYTKLGFNLVKILNPDYKYFNSSVDRYKRFHKFNFRKKILNKKYNLPIEMTEIEMVKKLGYDRIWDCGLFKYEKTF